MDLARALSFGGESLAELESEHDQHSPASSSDDDDSYVPDSLKSLFASAENTLKGFMDDDVFNDNGGKKKTVKEVLLGGTNVGNGEPFSIHATLPPKKEEEETLFGTKPLKLIIDTNLAETDYHGKEEDPNDLFTPTSDILGPFDNDLGSKVRPNPANLYQTTEEARDQAENEGGCPDHGDGCNLRCVSRTGGRVKMRLDLEGEDDVVVCPTIPADHDKEVAEEEDENATNSYEQEELVLVVEEKKQMENVISTVREGNEDALTSTNMITTTEPEMNDKGLVLLESSVNDDTISNKSKMEDKQSCNEDAQVDTNNFAEAPEEITEDDVMEEDKEDEDAQVDTNNFAAAPEEITEDDVMEEDKEDQNKRNQSELMANTVPVIESEPDKNDLVVPEVTMEDAPPTVMADDSLIKVVEEDHINGPVLDPELVTTTTKSSSPTTTTSKSPEAENGNSSMEEELFFPNQERLSAADKLTSSSTTTAAQLKKKKVIGNTDNITSISNRRRGTTLPKRTKRITSINTLHSSNKSSSALTSRSFTRVPTPTSCTTTIKKQNHQQPNIRSSDDRFSLRKKTGKDTITVSSTTKAPSQRSDKLTTATTSTSASTAKPKTNRLGKMTRSSNHTMRSGKENNQSISNPTTGKATTSTATKVQKQRSPTSTTNGSSINSSLSISRAVKAAKERVQKRMDMLKSKSSPANGFSSSSAPSLRVKKKMSSSFSRSRGKVVPVMTNNPLKEDGTENKLGGGIEKYGEKKSILQGEIKKTTAESRSGDSCDNVSQPESPSTLSAFNFDTDTEIKSPLSLTVPQSPAVQQQLQQSNHSIISSKNEHSNLQRNITASVSTSGSDLTKPRSPKLSTMKRYGSKQCPTNKTSKIDTVVMGTGPTIPRKTERKLTVPRTPRLSTTKKYGEKQCPTNTTTRTSPNRAVAPPSPKERKLTVPKAPRLSTLLKYGEKACPTVSDRTVLKDTFSSAPDSSMQGSCSSSTPRTLTKPVPFKLHESKRATVTPIADRTQSMTMGELAELFMRKSLRETPPPKKFEPRITTPISPKFASSFITPKREPPKSTAQIEEEMIAYHKAHPFKATPIAAGVLSSKFNAIGAGDHGVPKVPKKALTTPKEFRLSASNIERQGPLPPVPKREELKAAESPKAFKARPMPDLKYKPLKSPTLRKSSQKRDLTAPQPFRLSSVKKSAAATTSSVPSTEEMNVSECSKQFRARPMPDLRYKPPRSPSKKASPKRDLTTPRPFRLNTTERATEGDQPSLPSTEDVKASECAKQFRARPMPDLSYKPPSKPTQKKELTTPQEFCLRTVERAKAEESVATDQMSMLSSTAETKASQSVDSQFRARPMPDLSYKPPSKPTQKKELTTPREFRLRTVERAKAEESAATDHSSVPSSTAETKGSQSVNSQFRARPMPDLSYKPPPLKAMPKELTTPKPFQFKTLERAVASSQETVPSIEGPVSQFHARPMPNLSQPSILSSPKRELTTPRPFRLSVEESTYRAACGPPTSKVKVTNSQSTA